MANMTTPGFTNEFKIKCSQGNFAIGVFLNIPSPALVEIVGLLGFDWIFIDAEHSAASVETCEQMVRAAQARGITPIIRMPSADPSLVNRYLDTGAMGLLIPHFKSASIARTIVEQAKYAPIGRRGAGGNTRAAGYTFGLSRTEYTEWANRETMLIGIIEDIVTLEELPEILAIDEIDGFVIGHDDLAHSMGRPGQVHDPDVQAAIGQISSMVLAAGKGLCRVPTRADLALQEITQYRETGARLVAINFLMLLKEQARQVLAIRDQSASAPVAVQ